MCLVPISGDASFRSYYRGRNACNSTFIAMDAPPQREDLKPFLKVCDLMRRSGLHVPKVYAADCKQGFALLSDLGEKTYLQFMSQGDDGSVNRLMADALEALVVWQKASVPGCLPDYDRSLFSLELSLFREWFVRRHAGVDLTSALEKDWLRVKKALVDAAMDQPRVFVHRDFTVRNLVVSAPNPGILDFQDAVYGPITYDLLSLLRDAYITWPEYRIKGWVEDYFVLAKKHFALSFMMNRDQFDRAFDLMGIQRHLKVIGIFSRLAYRDEKRDYLAEIPRFLDYIRITAGKYEETTRLIKILDFLWGYVSP